MPRYGQNYTIGNTKVHMCGEKPLPKPCGVCGSISGFLCDGLVGEGKTCDMPLCEKCRVHQGEDTDYCPDHAYQGRSS